MLSKVMFLHLSDIHFLSETDEIINRSSKIAASTFKFLPVVQEVIVVVSGDVTWSGKNKQYDIAERFFSNLLKSIRQERTSLEVKVFVCPGNHDCDFSLNDETREAVIEKIRSGQGVPAPSLVRTATSIQSDFFEFRDKISKYNWDHCSPLSWQTTFPVGGKLIGIRCINVAWMSELKEKQGALIFPAEEIIPFPASKKPNLTISILHHPFNWFGQSTYRKFQAAVRNESQIIFCGHEHFQNISETHEINGSPTIQVDGGVLYDKNSPSKSKFNLVVVDLENDQYQTELYSWDGDRYVAEVDNEEWGSLRALPTSDRKNYSLAQEFFLQLSDPGANFSHSAKKSLNIDDIFVWPDLRLTDDPNVIKNLYRQHI